MNSAQIRQAFIDFFVNRQHSVVPSSSLIPAADPTLLFTNAGMVQFKDVFLGKEQRNYTRAVSVQRCVRAGGKHNDLENVGHTARHHTFFEMLGNFSFGDYFKHEAIKFAWEFLTQTLALPPEKLWITVFEDDDESADIWLKTMGVSAERFSRCGESDNFWSMGDTGPCGPCTEIFYDHGPEIAGGPPGSPDADGDRYIEIWNLVFMQFNRHSDGTMEPLPKPSVDTGMGFERLTAVLQGVHNNYETDLFMPIIRVLAKMAAVDDLTNSSLRVIADHIRSCTFLIIDGIRPSNEGRGYVLRRIIRRALRHGYKLNLNEAFFHKLVTPLVEVMGGAYPELVQSSAAVSEVLLLEEQQFARTLGQGMKILQEVFQQSTQKIIAGDVAFKLYDTYGFPVDLTADVAREQGFDVDMQAFESCMAEQRARSQAASQFAVDYNANLDLGAATVFTGYEKTSDKATVVALLQQGNSVPSLRAGEQGIVVLNTTPFYAESGGQIGDTGSLTAAGVNFVVNDTTKQNNVHLHQGSVQSGEIKVGDQLTATIDVERRNAIRRHHSATHLLHSALRQILGTHVVQKGSLVGPNRLRFDFTHHKAPTAEELRAIELLVNQQILHNKQAQTKLMSQEQAIASGAMALFGEKYGNDVRVLSLGDEGYSVELCGGTHVAATGDIGCFKIVNEAAIAAGTRRIEAVVGDAAMAYVFEQEDLLNNVAKKLKAGRGDLIDKVEAMLQRNRELDKELAAFKAKQQQSAGKDLAAQAEEIAGIKVLVANLIGADQQALRTTVEQLKDSLGTAVICLAAVIDDKVSLVAGVSKDCVTRIKAGDLVNAAVAPFNGRGGGRPDLAQAGVADAAKLDDVLSGAKDWIVKNIA